jgi:thioredoxin reductase (NADPH)
MKKIKLITEPRNNYSHVPSKKKYDLIVIGTGVAGYASAMYGARLGLSVLIVGEIPGGTLAITGKVENYPGIISIGGQELTQLFENHAMDYNVDSEIDIVEDIYKKNNEFIVSFSNKKYYSKTIIIATGTKVKKLNIPGEKEFFNKGVGYCALCDAAYVKGKIVAIAGGGDSAVKEAILLTEYAEKVYIVNNEKETHPEHQNKLILDRKIKNKEIEVINNNEIIEIKGNRCVEEIVLKQKHSGKIKVNVQGVFVYIGLDANSNLAKRVGVKLNKKKEIIVDQKSQTNVPGCFAAGDVTNTEWKQAIIGVSQGVTAAYYAYQYCLKK